MRSRRGIGLALLGACLLAVSSAAHAQPSSGWVNTSLLVGTVDDCSGSGAQTNTAEAVPCQSYNADLYETLEYTGASPEPADDADIDEFKVGADASFLYVEWILAGAWDQNTSPSHHYVIEIDVDPSTEMRGDNYVAIFGKTEFNQSGNPWVDAKQQGGFEAFADNSDSGTANDVGGTVPGTGDPSVMSRKSLRHD
jgi:hypothetical protein